MGTWLAGTTIRASKRITTNQRSVSASDNERIGGGPTSIRTEPATYPRPLHVGRGGQLGPLLYAVVPERAVPLRADPARPGPLAAAVHSLGLDDHGLCDASRRDGQGLDLQHRRYERAHQHRALQPHGSHLRASDPARNHEAAGCPNLVDPR